ncbi:MAG: hypothetical protein VKN56_12345 [Cyanobacteriota bacterium]|nr:hypothetical protein [Cyanobacteriota bacterium]
MTTTTVEPGGEADPTAPRVLVLTGGLIHLVHQLAVLPAQPPQRLAVLITGVLTRDPAALMAMQATMERWFALLRSADPARFGSLTLLPNDADLRPGEWDLCCLNNAWVVGQRSLVERLAIPAILIGGDGLGVYYRCARELRAILPSLLNRPIPETARRVQVVVSGRQPLWHRPPQPTAKPPLAARRALFETLVSSLEAEAEALVEGCRAAAGPHGPIWLCSVPNLAHQFPGEHLPRALLERWQRALPGFDPSRQRLVPIDHPKAPPGGSMGGDLPAWLTPPLRSSIPLEVLVRRLEQKEPERPIRVAGLTSALYGVRHLTGAAVVWLPVTPLWWHNPAYRRRPLEFLHRWLRARRMRLLTDQPVG